MGAQSAVVAERDDHPMLVPVTGPPLHGREHFADPVVHLSIAPRYSGLSGSKPGPCPTASMAPNWTKSASGSPFSSSSAHLCDVFPSDQSPGRFVRSVRHGVVQAGPIDEPCRREGGIGVLQALNSMG